ncbi:MAG: selenide, water dikinase SelD, partial [Armatimonadetes bacterium]|nr:selenide, water dikinase SelD [Armatimonadota bacterium]
MGLADLSRVLESLPFAPDPRVVVGLHPGDDAGVFQLTPDLLIVQTVDFFPPVLDDPYGYGQVAAANSLSDVYAMGGTPVTALNIVAFPIKDLGISVLTEILRGGSDKVTEAGAALLGGHTVTDKEPKYGLAVTGVVEKHRLVTNAGASPGDLLILTKPIGTGIATTAIKQQLATDDLIGRVTEIMASLNKAAAVLMADWQVRACTDITGFGLLGHALEMAQASNVTLEIDAASVPLISGIRD